MATMAGDRLGAQWRDYRTKIIPLDAPDIQARESRRAFYAGAQAMLAEIMKGLSPGLEPTDADLRKMDDLAAELKRFGAGVTEGRF